MEDFLHNIVRDQAGNVVGDIVHEIAGSGDEKTGEDVDVSEDMPLAVPAMESIDTVEPVLDLPPPFPSVCSELYKAFRMLENNR